LFSKELLSMKTFIPDVQDVNREWLLVDAAQKPLGRLAVQIADLLRGRNKPTFTPHVDTGAFVVVINARQVALSGKKEETKTYRSFSGYRNGLKITPAARVRERHPERMVEHAVKGMLPKNNLARGMFKRLKVYPAAEHPHAAQAPKPL